jgi:hypothetical protein
LKKACREKADGCDACLQESMSQLKEACGEKAERHASWMCKGRGTESHAREFGFEESRGLDEDNENEDSLISPSMLEVQGTRRRRSNSKSGGSSRGGLTGGLPDTLPGGRQKTPRTPGCCKHAGSCMGCGAGGLGICHKNAAQCGSPICGGRFDARAVAPQCR